MKFQQGAFSFSAGTICVLSIRLKHHRKLSLKKMKTIAFANHKGGCAKTTTALNVAVTLAMTGASVLVVDLDPQGNLSAALSADLEELEETRRTTYRLMLDEKADYSFYLLKPRTRLDLIPNCLDADAETLLGGQPVSRELMLKEKLKPARKAYDYCVVDTPPSLGVPTLNALAVSDLTIVPVDSSMFALLGLKELLRTVAKVRRAHAPEMIVTALSSIYASRQNLDKNIRQRVIEKFTEDFVFHTTIPRAVAVGEATSTMRAVVEANPESASSFAYHKLVAEITEILRDEEVRSETAERFAR